MGLWRKQTFAYGEREEVEGLGTRKNRPLEGEHTSSLSGCLVAMPGMDFVRVSDMVVYTMPFKSNYPVVGGGSQLHSCNCRRVRMVIGTPSK